MTPAPALCPKCRTPLAKVIPHCPKDRHCSWGTHECGALVNVAYPHLFIDYTRRRK